MGQPAARITDMHTCPMVTGTVPHVGGPVLPAGAPTVLIGGLPAARVGDMATCVGPPDVIVKGSATVLIGGMPAARMGDSTAHGGVIVVGCPTVLIGDAGSAGALMVCSIPVSPVEEKGWWDSWGSDATHGVLDAVGLVPVFGEPANLIGAGIYTIEGKPIEAGLDLAAMIPVGGQAATAAKYGKKTAGVIAEQVEKKAVKEIRVGIAKPVVEDVNLSKYMDTLYRPNAKIGNGSTADAVRHELATGEPVGGVFHTQKAQDYSKALQRWLDKNSTASSSDREAAENVLHDLQNALGGK
jgi:uncharacterized Zn-binding protein involved in type VI secretion